MAVLVSSRLSGGTSAKVSGYANVLVIVVVLRLVVVNGKVSGGDVMFSRPLCVCVSRYLTVGRRKRRGESSKEMVMVGKRERERESRIR